EAAAVDRGVGTNLVDGIGQLNNRMPLVGKVPPWKRPHAAPDPDAPRPFGWMHAAPLGADAGAVLPDRIAAGPDAGAAGPDAGAGAVGADAGAAGPDAGAVAG